MTDYAKGGSAVLAGHFFDVTMEFPEFPNEIIRYRRVGPCRGKSEAIRRILNSHQSEYRRAGHGNADFTVLNISIRKVDSFE